MSGGLGAGGARDSGKTKTRSGSRVSALGGVCRGARFRSVLRLLVEEWIFPWLGTGDMRRGKVGGQTEGPHAIMRTSKHPGADVGGT